MSAETTLSGLDLDVKAAGALNRLLVTRARVDCPSLLLLLVAELLAAPFVMFKVAEVSAGLRGAKS
jgi:hypothetical protein